MDWVSIATASASVGAVIISAYTLYCQRKEDKPSIKVEIRTCLMDMGFGRLSDLMIVIYAANAGKKPVVLASFGFLLPAKKKASFVRPQSSVTFPHELQPEQSCQVWMDVKEFAENLKDEGFTGEITLIGFYGDQVGRTYKSEKWKFAIDMLTSLST